MAFYKSPCGKILGVSNTPWATGLMVTVVALTKLVSISMTTRKLTDKIIECLIRICRQMS